MKTQRIKMCKQDLEMYRLYYTYEKRRKTENQLSELPKKLK